MLRHRVRRKIAACAHSPIHAGHGTRTCQTRWRPNPNPNLTLTLTQTLTLTLTLTPTRTPSPNPAQGRARRWHRFPSRSRALSTQAGQASLLRWALLGRARAWGCLAQGCLRAVRAARLEPSVFHRHGRRLPLRPICSQTAGRSNPSCDSANGRAKGWGAGVAARPRPCRRDGGRAHGAATRASLVPGGGRTHDRTRAADPTADAARAGYRVSVRVGVRVRVRVRVRVKVRIRVKVRARRC